MLGVYGSGWVFIANLGTGLPCARGSDGGYVHVDEIGHDLSDPLEEA